METTTITLALVIGGPLGLLLLTGAVLSAVIPAIVRAVDEKKREEERKTDEEAKKE